ncbi:MAG TPA: fibronectin type III-like domain-contianing protein, partial [Ilumatobacteraceae bacterium]|nr:fibronectin type III-like domain-contianing protein [Ilumatobacteraceae bacterium]
TIPADEADLPAFDRDAKSFTYDRWHGWWRMQREGIAPAYPFGHGLSYTTFALGDAEVVLDGDTIVVSGSVSNTGDRDGADVVQVYAELPDPQSPARLIGFARVDVAAGTTEAFTIIVPTSRLERRVDGAWMSPSGRHLIRLARNAGDPDATTTDVTL